MTSRSLVESAYTLRTLLILRSLQEGRMYSHPYLLNVQRSDPPRKDMRGQTTVDLLREGLTDPGDLTPIRQTDNPFRDKNQDRWVVLRNNLSIPFHR